MKRRNRNGTVTVHINLKKQKKNQTTKLGKFDLIQINKKNVKNSQINKSCD